MNTKLLNLIEYSTTIAQKTNHYSYLLQAQEGHSLTRNFSVPREGA